MDALKSLPWPLKQLIETLVRWQMRRRARLGRPERKDHPVIQWSPSADLSDGHTRAQQREENWYGDQIRGAEERLRDDFATWIGSSSNAKKSIWT
jgi:hypothetical protein